MQLPEHKTCSECGFNCIALLSWTKCALQLLFALSKPKRSDSDIITLGSWSVLSLRLIGTFFLLEIETRCCISTTETAQWQHSG